MNTEDMQGPGVDEWLIEQVRSWGIRALTEIQVLAVKDGVAAGESLVVCAPTSSGKTLIGEIAVACSLKRGQRALYLVSHRALADQKYEDFRVRFGEMTPGIIASVAISTGDREEGDFGADLLIATYERALGLVLSGELNSRTTTIIADELQILGDENRGPNIEALCAILRQRGVGQFVALTATVENPADLAGWLNCKLCSSRKRDVTLHQEIWYRGDGQTIDFGEDHLSPLDLKAPLPTDVLGAVAWLVRADRSPVLVFTESRREAAQLAMTYSKNRVRAAAGIAIAEQLELFSEPTEASEQLQENAQRRVAFHSADLTAEERHVIESGFIDSKFEVCFATSTLAAGVNFPFRSVVFPKLTYQWGQRSGTRILRSDYRNMSGRAGRLGMHADGFAVLMPNNQVELRHASQIVLPENDIVSSQMVSLSMRRSVMVLIASGIVDEASAIRGFFENTLYWHQMRSISPPKLDLVIDRCKKSVEWLVDRRFVEKHEDLLIPTPLGKACANSGLLPTTVSAFVQALAVYQADLEKDFDDLIPGFLYWICSSDEFLGATPSRFLPYPGTKSFGSVSFLSGKRLLQPLDRTNTQLAQCVHGLLLFIQGQEERKIAYETKISSGYLHRLALDVSWLIDGLHRITGVPELNCSQKLSNQISMLSRRVRWGAPAEALDMIRVAEMHRVPGFGRQRAMALLEQGLSTFEDILGSTKEKLLKVLRNERRTDSLLGALAKVVGLGPNRLAKIHARVANELGIVGLINDCNETLGTEYETAITRLLQLVPSWEVKVLDDGIQRNVPDILLSLDGATLLIECKTCQKTPALIKKEDAFAVLQKASDFAPEMRRVTLGKPEFDEHSKLKAQSSPGITLVEHSLFMEALLRVLARKITALEFVSWLGTPGSAELNRLPGKPSYSS